ncbi:hypothetical protein TI05_08760 [Achromatium sp. WMS3]|nr:hypothetical protein TI05_08760 [Achromatium sp. WMS3]
MYTTTTLRTQVLNEIQNIPENRLEEIYNLVHFFRMGIEAQHQNTAKTILQFAGAWQDMDDETFTELQEEIAKRRKLAFSNRSIIDAHFD